MRARSHFCVIKMKRFFCLPNLLPRKGMSEEIGQVQNCHTPPPGAPSWAKLSFQCEMQWHQLEETPNPAERHCSKCHENVHLVTNEREFESAAKLRHCDNILPSSLLPYSSSALFRLSRSAKAIFAFSARNWILSVSPFSMK